MHSVVLFKVVRLADVRLCGLLLLSFVAQVGQLSAEHPELCERCLPVVDALGFKLPGAAAAAAGAAAAAAAEKATAAA
jgi:hypothetical protein